MEKVMLISSWYDDITEQRHRLMANSPYLKGYGLSHCNAVHRPHAQVTCDELYERVTTDITLNKPDIILVHIGAAYMDQPEIFKKCFKKIREEYPLIKLGVERNELNEEEIDDFGLFDTSAEMIKLENLFFKVIYSRR